MSKMSDFHDWLMGQVGRDDPIGDFAADAKSDRSALGIGSKRDEWLSHLTLNGADYKAIDAFKQAWTEYSRLG